MWFNIMRSHSRMCVAKGFKTCCRRGFISMCQMAPMYWLLAPRTTSCLLEQPWEVARGLLGKCGTCTQNAHAFPITPPCTRIPNHATMHVHSQSRHHAHAFPITPQCTCIPNHATMHMHSQSRHNARAFPITPPCTCIPNHATMHVHSQSRHHAHAFPITLQDTGSRKGGKGRRIVQVSQV
jgi:hypothetical protein